MDSQLTLIDINAPPTAQDAHTILEFTKDSFRNTELVLRGTDRTVYLVETKTNSTGGSGSTTASKVIPGGTQKLVRSFQIKKNDILPDKITFEGLSPIKLSSWIKERAFFDPYQQQQQGQHQHRYVWKPTGLHEIALYREDMPLLPIAWFQSALPTGEPPSLSLQSTAETMQDIVLASLLLVEQEYRAQSSRMASFMDVGKAMWGNVFVTT